MKNVILISADFPYTYYQFAKAFHKNGCNVFVIGSTPYYDLHPELKGSITEYYQTYEMENIDKMSEIVQYFVNKYGPIDFLESNNEYWLRSDSILRERFGISSGIYPHQLDDYQRKSSMKQYFMKAGAHVAPFILSDDLEELRAFAKEYNYPIFAKPDIGVGAAGNYKINNDEELVNYLNNKPHIPYFVEAYVEGRIITFDGIANANSEPVICANEIFPREIFNMHITKSDMVYYVNKVVPPDLLSLGKNIIKSLGLKNRFFHTELFIAENSIKGWFEKGDIVALEVNIRTPGGYTPDLLNFGLSTNLYQMFADVICYGYSDEYVGPHYYAVYASRRNGKQYFFNEEDIKRTYLNNLCTYGDMPKVLSDLMCDRFYMAKFEDEKEAVLFGQYVTRLANVSYAGETKFEHLLGEDRRIMDEKNSDASDDLPICDRHIDGA